MWATPQARDFKDSGAAVNWQKVADRKKLAGEAMMWGNGPPDPPTQTPGQPSSPSGPTSRLRLNPAFVLWLMGWPEGHLSLDGLTRSAS